MIATIRAPGAHGAETVDGRPGKYRRPPGLLAPLESPFGGGKVASSSVSSADSRRGPVQVSAIRQEQHHMQRSMCAI